MIEVGEYVRTETGFIRRIKSVDKTEATENCPVNMYWCNLDKPIKILKEYSKDTIYAIEMSDAKKLKHSKNIIDLIEVGDYVNGEKIEQITTDSGYKKYYTTGFGVYDEYDNESVIHSILTKEQYEANCYRVKEE